MSQAFGDANEFNASRSVYVPKDSNAGYSTGIRYRGPWDNTGIFDPNGTNYFINDVVSYNNRSYLCVAANTASIGAGGILPTDSRYWRLVPSDAAMLSQPINDFGDPAPSTVDDFANPARQYLGL